MTAALFFLLFVLVSIEVAALAFQRLALALDFSPLFREGLAFGFEVAGHRSCCCVPCAVLLCVGCACAVRLRGCVCRSLCGCAAARGCGAFFRQAKLNVAGRSSGLAALRVLSRCTAASVYCFAMRFGRYTRANDDDFASARTTLAHVGLSARVCPVEGVGQLIIRAAQSLFA